MPFISITRLRLRSFRFLPLFMLHTSRSLRQVKAAPRIRGGSKQAERRSRFRGGSILADRSCTFWTMTAWDDQASMQGYTASGAHRTAMPRLLEWCDEASVVHWIQPDDTLPSWNEADRRMRTEGRPSKVRKPSIGHAGLAYRQPRLAGARPIAPVPHASAPP